MTTIHLTARITENGQLEINLPAGLPPGEVEVTIQIDDENPIEGFREGWRDVMEGRLYPASALWDDDDIEVEDIE